MDAFGRSLTERESQSAKVDDVSVSKVVPTVNDSVERNGDKNSITTANSMASDQFMQNMIMGSTDSGTLPGVEDVDSSVVYESPMSVIKFSLDSVVDPSLFASSVKGQWKSMFMC